MEPGRLAFSSSGREREGLKCGRGQTGELAGQTHLAGLGTEGAGRRWGAYIQDPSLDGHGCLPCRNGDTEGKPCEQWEELGLALRCGCGSLRTWGTSWGEGCHVYEEPALYLQPFLKKLSNILELAE